MIKRALFRVWLFIGDPRTSLVWGGLMLSETIEKARQHDWVLFPIALVITLWLIIPSWRRLPSIAQAIADMRASHKPKPGTWRKPCANNVKRVALLAGYQPIGKHVDEPARPPRRP